MFEDLSSSRAQNLNLLQVIQKKGILASRHQMTPENMPRASQLRQIGFSNFTWKLRALRIVYFISKFISLLRQNTENIKFKLIDKKIFSIIHDQSSEFGFYKNNGFLYQKPTIIERTLYKIQHIIPKLILEKIAKFLYKSDIFSDQNVIFPDSYSKLIIDIISVIIILINFFYIPLSVGFSLESSDPISRCFFVLQVTIFILEIIFNFNTAYYKEGLIHTRRNSIAKNYFNTSLLLDFIVVIFYIISSLTNQPVLGFVMFLRFKKLSTTIKNLEEVSNLREKWATQIDLLKLVLLVLFVSHFCACAWFLVGKTETEYGRYSWLLYYNAYDQTKSVQYVYSLYWSTITLLTVGYGDLTPQTYSERIFCIFTSTIAIGIFGYAINSIGSIFKELDDRNRKFQDALQSINYYLRSMGIDKSLMLKVRRYFEHIYMQRENDDSSISQQLMQEMTPDLKQEVQVALYKKIILRSKFLQQNVSEECLIELCSIVQDRNVHPNEILFEKDKLSKQIYFIRQGEIQIYYQRKYFLTGKIREKLVKKIKSNGHVLSEKQFLLNQTYEYSAKTVKFTHISYIDYSQFIQVLKNHPEDYQKYCMMKENLLYNSNYKAVKTVCEICGYLHILSKCPFPFYQINKNKLIRQLNTSENQQRQQNQRKDRLKYELSTIQNSALAYCIDNQIFEVDLIDEDHLKSLGFLKENQDLFLQLEEKDEEDFNYNFEEPDIKPRNIIQRMSLKIYNSDNWEPLDKINTGIQETQTQQLYGMLRQTKPVTPKIPDITPVSLDNDLQIIEVYDHQKQSKENSRIQQLYEPLQNNIQSRDISISKSLSCNQSQSLRENKVGGKQFQRKVKIDNIPKISGRKHSVVLEGCKFRFVPQKPQINNSSSIEDTSSQRGKQVKLQLNDEQHTNRIESMHQSVISINSENIQRKTVDFSPSKENQKDIQTFEIDQQKYFRFYFPNQNYEEVITRFEYQRKRKRVWQSKKDLFKSSKLQTIFNFSKKRQSENKVQNLI